MTDPVNSDITTGHVLARLRRLGLHVTPTMIEGDTAAHYLPERETGYYGRSGASGIWEPWMERRAERLYRLRAVAQRTRLGPKGDVLRLMLTIADGWGWEHVRETCIDGYRKLSYLVSQGTTNRLRGKPLTLDSLRSVADDIAAEQYKPADPNQEQIDRVKMSLGLFKFGTAPDTRMGTLSRIIDDLVPDADLEARAFKPFLPIMWTLVASGESEAFEILRGDVDRALIKRAGWHFRYVMWRTRMMFRRKFRPPSGGRFSSMNPLAGFGAAKDPRFPYAFRNKRGRLTPAQMLGGQFAHAVVSEYGLRRLNAVSEIWLKWFVYWLQSEECSRWIEQMEREVSQRKN